MDYSRLSFWHESVGDLEPSPTPKAHGRYDVIILGGGFTGLWTGIYLLRKEPKLKIAIVEKEIAGFGASGRNGGWCSSLFPWSASQLERKYGFEQAVALRRAMVETVAEVGRISKELGIDCDFRQAGTYTLIRSDAQAKKARHELEQAGRFGVDELKLLPIESAPQASKSMGAVFDPGCAAIHPAKLVRGLARVFRKLGGHLFEKTEVTGFEAGQVETSRGLMSTSWIVEALEGYRSALPGMKRDSIPIYSLMIATEPIDPKLLDEIGIFDGATFADFRQLIVYGQRTKDNRIAFGGRGAPYHFGSKVSQEYEQVPRIHQNIERYLFDMFPQLAGTRISHRWGGALGVKRDWMASVRVDRASKICHAGGYVGDGVGTSNLFGRSLADLILGIDSPESRLCFVGHESKKWEPEPLRFLGARSAVLAASIADEIEGVTGRQSPLSKVVASLTGK